jgi:ubiquinone/menaquinone biosynthesis C-methylase UbiE
MEPREYALMDAAEDHMWWYRALHRRLLDALAGVHGSLLDAGCGTGGLLARIGEERPDLKPVGLEWAEAACRRTAEKSRQSIVRGSINALPFAEASFDAALAADVLCHRAVEPTRALAELRRVLRPAGRLIVNMPAYAWLHSAHDRIVHNAWRCTASQLAAMLHTAGFVRIQAHYWNGLLLPIMVAQRKLLASDSAASDVAAFPPWLDAILHGMTEIERRLPFGLPGGGSVLATAERP